jgi:hypothetical protein
MSGEVSEIIDAGEAFEITDAAKVERPDLKPLT